MTPTNELRFVEREVNQQISKVPDQWERRTLRILQQKWEGTVYQDTDYSKVYGKHKEEWRDVPVVREQANAS